MMRIKKNDTVIVVSGKDKGLKGTILEIVPKKNLVKVSGVAISTKHQKARKQGETSKIVKLETFIDVAKVMLVSSEDAKPFRVNYKLLEDGKKVRISNKNKDTI